ncbi:MAG: PD-(D/E)XK nuclease family protein [Gammaproteobacteria bacterium]|nr:PD-(D/E)XK nuclease family protein [Gammaproteobacteria bacterium]
MQFTDETVIVTPNRRLALFLSQKNDLQQLRTKQSWHPNKILPLTNWLEELWQLHITEKVVLNTHQLNYLWANLTHNHTITDLAIKAWSLTKQWQVLLNFDTLHAGQDKITFQNWTKLFTKNCEQHSYIDHDSLPQELTKRITKLILPKKLIVVGFDQIVPQLAQFFTALQKANCQVEIQKPVIKSQPPLVQAFSSQTEELAAIARWSSQLFNRDEHSSIGCVFPNLTTIRDEIEYQFNKHATGEFDISAGKIFAAYPLIFDALKILELMVTDLSVYELEHLLTSPFLRGADAELFARAQLARQLFSVGIEKISLRKIQSFAKQSQRQYGTPLLAEIFDQLLLLRKECQQQQTAYYWKQFFVNVLHITGWPGERALAHDEQHLLTRWQELLIEFQSLQLVTNKLSYSDALQLLIGCAKRTIYQPKYRARKIQILGALEAVGLEFDHLWVAGLDADVWPATSYLNPFLPAMVQRQLNMPHSSVEHELRFCQQLMQRWQTTSDDLTYSYHYQDQDRMIAISPLLKDYCQKNNTEENMLGSSLQPTFVELERITDGIAPAVHVNETIKGGTNIFKLQALCPFRAFIECRLLGTEHTDSMQLGLSQKDRGILVHAILEAFWHKVETAQQLHNLDHAQLESIISTCIKQALLALTTKSGEKLTPRYIELETKRLQEIMHNFVAIEKLRQDFTVVAQEQKLTTKIGQIPVHLRVDRVDRLADGSLLIIDYKTGHANKNNWFGERPEEPQLPLYCIAAPQKIAALAFLQVKAAIVKYSGCSLQNTTINNIETLADWENQIQLWKKVMTKLSNDFLQGNATVDPKNKHTTCRYCHLKTLCRIHELQDKVDE